MSKILLQERTEKLRSVSNFAIALNLFNTIVFLCFAVGEARITYLVFCIFGILCFTLLFKKAKKREIEFKDLKSIKRTSPQKVAIALIFCFQLSNILKFQDWSWDGLWYHSPAARLWSKELDFSSLYSSSFANSYPGSSEIFQATIWHFFPNAPSQLGSFLSYLIIIILIRNVFLGLGLPAKVADSALLVFIATPTMFSQPMTSYNDVIFGGVVFLNIVIGLKYFESGKLVFLVGALSLASVAASIKYQGIVLLGLTFFLALFKSVVIRKVARTLRTNQENRIRLLHLPFLFVVFLSGCVWEIKNWINFGNPLYPFNLGLGPIILIQGPLGTPNSAFLDNESKLAGFENSPLAFLQGALHVVPNFIYDARHGGFGFFWPILLVTAIALAIRSRGPFQRIFLTSLLFTLITPANWWPRYEVHLFLGALVIFMYGATQKLRFKNLFLRLITLGSLFQLVIYLPFVGPYPNFFAQPHDLESLKSPWVNSQFANNVFSWPKNGQIEIAPELSEISNSSKQIVAFWWVEPLILPIMGVGSGNELIEIKGVRSEIKQQLEKIMPDFFVTRQELVISDLPNECIKIEPVSTGIYGAKVYKCEWRY
jgi:hypothetical protein